VTSWVAIMHADF